MQNFPNYAEFGHGALTVGSVVPKLGQGVSGCKISLALAVTMTPAHTLTHSLGANYVLRWDSKILLLLLLVFTNKSVKLQQSKACCVHSVFVFCCHFEPRSHWTAEIRERMIGIPTGKNNGM